MAAADTATLRTFEFAASAVFSDNVGKGLGMRPACDEDRAFLRALYADLRAEELSRIPWPSAMKQAFLDQQFRLQDQHFRTHHPQGDFLILTTTRPPQASVDIGRLYLDRTSVRWRLIDIGLFAAWRGRGFGETILRWIQTEASDAGASGVDLHVAIDNLRAHALYENAGFRVGGEVGGTHQSMTWTVS